MTMRASDYVVAGICGIFGFVAGLLLGSTLLGIVGALAGIGFALVAARFGVRPAISSTVFVGTMAGVLVGASIVESICLPDTCSALEVAGGTITGIAAFVGVGIVAALVMRSFDEYNEHVVAGTPPPTPGCEVPPEGEAD